MTQFKSDRLSPRREQVTRRGLHCLTACLLFAAGCSGAENNAQATTERARPEATIPVITAVVNSASFQSGGIVPGTWITLLGTGLSNTTRSWAATDFINGELPPQLDFIYVTFNAKHGYVSYVSPLQVNVLVPDDIPPGITADDVNIQAAGQLLQSNYFNVKKVALAPALFTFTSRYAAAVHNADGSYSGPASLIAGVTTTPARAGEVVQLFGTGFGSSNPPTPTGLLFTTAAPLAQAVTATVGGVSAKVAGYLVSPGVYQFNVTIPDVPTGDAPIAITAGGFSTQSNLFLSVSK